ncbi:histidinol-phosphate aminotransferase [Choiromyces venosus 120613-1]|uniref:histidinol-phosphate transaminase n=1 Tax=Choiromyces venosus 120613-1 TaxID=1336337 RepID=A0A3N4JJQ4_9PEZI|nr:histidinol-phosphate aminotransferase [Choiromyces venosus 120613-1]
MAPTSSFNLQTCARKNILQLIPYRCARDDYKDDGSNILLDANENAYGPSLPINGVDGSEAKIGYDLTHLNRYPDPHQEDLKQLFCNYRNTNPAKPLTPANLFLGVGSDEAIDALLRCFCIPGKDKILTCPPTYGMYSVSAQVNDVEVVKETLDLTSGKFELRPEAINKRLSEDPTIKIVYICSPGNPTASIADREAVRKVLAHPTWNGVVVVDEAYIDFAPEGSSLAPWAVDYPNLVVMQTLSKAFGLAGIRLGAAFTSPEIAQLLNNLKAPYSISSPTSSLAMAALSPAGLAVKEENVRKLLAQRDRLLFELPKIPGIGRFLGGFESNFLLVEVLDKNLTPDSGIAKKVYEELAEGCGVIVRYRGGEPGCAGCLRITVGTEAEVSKLLENLKEVLKGVRRE